MSSRWPLWSRLWGPMITAQSRLGEVTAQSRRGHSSITARSQLSHGEVTAQSWHLQYDHGSVTARSAQSRHSSRLSHGWLWPFWSPWAHGELTVSSHGGHFFSHWNAPLRKRDQAVKVNLGFYYITDGLVQETRNSRTLAMELRLFCGNLSICRMMSL